MQKDESLGDVTAHIKGNYKVMLKNLNGKFFVLHGKNSFAEVFKNLVRYRSENIFVWAIKIIM